jgi:hypothetical protein
MNQNIRKFLMQAEEEILAEVNGQNLKSPLSFKQRVSERFAQILVNYCADIADGHHSPYPHLSTGNMIKSYFGVNND